jgi:hypothetical protein
VAISISCNLYCNFIVCILLRFKKSRMASMSYKRHGGLYLEVFFKCFGVSSHLSSP